MAINPSPSYSDFLGKRSCQAFWLTRNVAYRVGAAFALCANQLKMTPNMVSVVALFANLAGAALAMQMGHGVLAAGFVLLVLGEMSYGLDCADGLLARVTGKGSDFGIILDKVFDGIGMILVPIILASGAMNVLPDVFPNWVWIWFLGLAICGRMCLATAVWLNEGRRNNYERLLEDTRVRNKIWILKRTVGNLADDVMYRALLGFSWGLGLFWEFTALYGSFCFLLFCGYLYSLKGEILREVA